MPVPGENTVMPVVTVFSAQFHLPTNGMVTTPLPRSKRSISSGRRTIDGGTGCRGGRGAHADSSAVWVTSSSPGVLTWLDEDLARRPSATARSAARPCAPRTPRRRCRARRGRSGSRRESTEQTSNRRHPGSSRTDASAFAAMPARNSSRRPGRTSICTIRLNIVVLRLGEPLYAILYTTMRTSNATRTRTAMAQARIAPETLRGFGTRVLAALGVPRRRRRAGRRQPRAGRPLGPPVARLPPAALVRRPAPVGGHAGGDRPRGALRHRPRSCCSTAATASARCSPSAPAGWRSSAPATHGVGVVGVRNSNHFGTAMYFTRRAAADGCVAVLTTNASPAMAPWGGREKRLGTNPWSIAAPGTRRRDRRRRHRQHRRRPRQGLPGEEPRRADPGDLGAHRRRGADDRPGARACSA